MERSSAYTLLNISVGVTGHPRDTLYTDSATRDQPWDGNLRQSAIFRQVPPNPAKLCQDHFPNPILLRARVDQATKSTICTLFSHFPTFFPYATSWFHHTVHVRSLIISTLLHIIATRTHSVTVGLYSAKLYLKTL